VTRGISPLRLGLGLVVSWSSEMSSVLYKSCIFNNILALNC